MNYVDTSFVLAEVLAESVRPPLSFWSSPDLASSRLTEYEAWVRRLAEGGKAFPFDSLSWDLRTTLVRSMASQLVDYWTAISSAGSPPGADTSKSASTSSSESSESTPPANAADTEV